LLIGIVSFGVVLGKGQGGAKGLRRPFEENESERLRKLVSDREGLVDREKEGVRAPMRIQTNLSPKLIPASTTGSVEVVEAEVTDCGKDWNASEAFLPVLPNGSGFLKSMRIGTAASSGDDR